MVGKNRNPPWSDLPQELLSTIANFLTSNPISIFTFRSICHSWRSACPPLSNSSLLSPLLPLIIPSTPYNNFNNSVGYSKLSVTIIYAFYRPLQLPQPKHGSSSSLLSDAWILFVDEFITGKPSIRKPFSNSSYFTPINFPNVNLIDSNVRELGRFYNFSCSSNYDEYRECKLSKPRFCVADANKVVMFPIGIVAIALHEDGTLGMYRVEVGSNEGIIVWETIHDGKGFRFDDIVEYKGRVLGVDRRGRVYEIKYHSSELTPFVAPIAGGGGRRKRLVESLERLYLVVRCHVNPGRSKKFARLPNGVKEKIRKIKFKVYELNEEEKKWIEISSLGDRSFSFGRNFSFSASSKELGTCVKNCILFTRHSFLSYSWNADDFTGFKKCELGLDISVCHLHETDNFGDIESYPGYSDSLWPPPNWLWSIDRLNRVTIVESAIEGILDKVPENYKTDVERADDPNPTVLEFVKVIFKLKKLVIKLQEEEIACKNKLQPLQEAMDKLNEVDDLFEQTKTWSRATIAETFGVPDYCKMSQACHESFLRLKLGILRMDSHLFSIEEFFTEVEMSLTSRLAPVVTLAQ